jgi:C1A family cysteine protease
MFPKASPYSKVTEARRKAFYTCKVSRLPETSLKMMELPPQKTALPASVDLRSKFPPVYDQGQLGSCTANALCGAFAYNASGFAGSRLFLYYNERNIEGTVSYDSGAYLHDGIKALEKQGLCPETAWPYLISKYRTKPTAACYTAALKDMVLTAQNIQPTLPIMKQALSLGFPFVIGFRVYTSFETSAVAATGMVPVPNTATEQLLGGHAVCVVGYDDVKQCFICRNSWGSGWGDKGYFYAPYAYFTDPTMTSDLWYISSVKK